MCLKNYEVLVALDDDDATMNNDVVKQRISSYYFVRAIYGTSKSKIDAINRDMELSGDWDILVNMSDDMRITVDNFDEILRADFKKYFPDLDGVLHYNDGNQKSNVMTMSIMGRKYYDRFNYIYHPDYISLWSDCEATNVAKLLGKYKYMGDHPIWFRHMHPAFGLSESDEQYRKNESPEYWAKDEKTYQERASKDFYI